MNKYQYVGNNPVNYIDITGLYGIVGPPSSLSWCYKLKICLQDASNTYNRSRNWCVNDLNNCLSQYDPCKIQDYDIGQEIGWKLGMASCYKAYFSCLTIAAGSYNTMAIKCRVLYWLPCQIENISPWTD